MNAILDKATAILSSLLCATEDHYLSTNLENDANVDKCLGEADELLKELNALREGNNERIKALLTTVENLSGCVKDQRKCAALSKSAMDNLMTSIDIADSVLGRIENPK
jgi:hypothetical protein